MSTGRAMTITGLIKGLLMWTSHAIRTSLDVSSPASSNVASPSRSPLTRPRRKLPRSASTTRTEILRCHGIGGSIVKEIVDPVVSASPFSSTSRIHAHQSSKRSVRVSDSQMYSGGASNETRASCETS